VDTEMAQEGLQAFSEALNTSKEKAFEQAMNDVPLRKMSEPDEIAQFTSFLISDAQSSITGQTLDINNGAMMP
jgi:NAD(P)-dependent dehydrogenase (short-subunit alcohol dehydrogenase family)